MTNFDYKNISAKDLIMSILFVMTAPSIPVRDLIEVARLMGLSENNTRVTLSRLVQKNRVAHDTAGNYSLAGNSFMQRTAAAWREGEQRRMATWTGDWIMCRLPIPSPSQPIRKKTLWALDFLGFRNILSGLWMRPNNLVVGLKGTRDKLFKLGAESGIEVSIATDFSPQAIQLLYSAERWGVPERDALYQFYYEALKESDASAENPPTLENVVDGFIMGYQVIHILTIDPLLPDEIQPSKHRAQLTDYFITYEAFGCALWNKLVFNL